MADLRRSTGQMPYLYRHEGIAGMSALDRREEAQLWRAIASFLPAILGT